MGLEYETCGKGPASLLKCTLGNSFSLKVDPISLGRSKVESSWGVRLLLILEASDVISVQFLCKKLRIHKEGKYIRNFSLDWSGVFSHPHPDQ